MEDEEEFKATLKDSLLPRKDDELPIDVGLRHTTKALFYEYRLDTTYKGIAPYSLKDYDYEREGVTYLSMYMIYMECDSEYEAAIVLLGSFSHWNRLKKATWFKPYLKRWEEERNIRDEAIARSMLVKLAEAGNVTAARTIYTNSQKGNKPGRPSKSGKSPVEASNSTIAAMLKQDEEENE